MMPLAISSVNFYVEISSSLAGPNHLPRSALRVTLDSQHHQKLTRNDEY